MLLALLVCYGLEVLFRALFGLALHKGMTKQEQIRVQIMANFIFCVWFLVCRAGKQMALQTGLPPIIYGKTYRRFDGDWAVWTVCDWHHRWIFAVSSAKHICFL